MLMWHGYGDLSLIRASSWDIAPAKNSLVFSVKARCSLGVNSCRHIFPVIGSNPPIPVSQAAMSVMEMDVGHLNTMEFREIPSAAYLMKRSQSLRSNFVSLVSLTDLNLSALASSILILFMK